MKTMIIDIEGMSCEHCVRHVTDALQSLEGVSTVVVSLENRQARVQAGDSLDEAAINAAVDEAGYEVTRLQVA